MGCEPCHPLPDWVPIPAQRYLEHTEQGCSIRELARRSGCHASTVLRQVRRVELRRDDPLVDAALQALALAHFPAAVGRIPAPLAAALRKEDPKTMLKPAFSPDTQTADANLDLLALPALRRLCDPHAVLAVADDMDKAVVVREDRKGAAARTVVIDCKVAEAMALKDWIKCDNPGRVSRYRITAAGRAALRRIMAKQESQASAQVGTGFADTQSAFGDQHRVWGEKTVADPDTRRPRRVRYNTAESPITALARRKGKDGKPFLDAGMVQAGERLREDFELAQMGPRVTQNWDRFLTGGDRGGFGSGGGSGSAAAHKRFRDAMGYLGPGLSDVALRCCCFLEGLETAEKRLGWSARSAKIVLRIALERLRKHYDELAEPQAHLMG